MRVSNFREIVKLRKSCFEKNFATCENCNCPLKSKGSLGITVCELVTSHINAQPSLVEIVNNCPVEDDPLGMKNFFEQCEKGYIRPTSQQLDIMKSQYVKCQGCPANTRYTMHHSKLNITISPHLCATLKSTVRSIIQAINGNSCSIISPTISKIKKTPRAFSKENNF